MKSGRIALLIIVCLLMCIMLYGCGKVEQPEASDGASATPTTNTLNVEMGKQQYEQEDVLKATDVSGISLEYAHVPVDSLLTQEKEEILNMIRALLEPEFLSEDGTFYEEKGYYLSTVSIKAFHANAKNYVLMERVLVFDSEKILRVVLDVTYSETKGYIITRGSTSEQYWEPILENEEQEYILIVNGGKVSALTEENELLPTYGTQVEGDYYGALDENLRFSMESLKENLLWVEQESGTD